MDGLVGHRNVYLDVDKIARALSDGHITKLGSSCVAGEALEIAQDMVDGAVYGAAPEDLCTDCPKLEEIEGNYTSLRGDLEILREDLKLAVKQQDWNEVNRVLTGLNILI